MPTIFRIAITTMCGWALLSGLAWAQAHPAGSHAAPTTSPAGANEPIRLPPKGNPTVQQAPPGATPTTDWKNSLIGLAGVVVFGISAIWLLKRLQPAGNGMLPSEVLEPLGRHALNGQHQLHLLRCGTKVILVALHPGGVQTLTEITDPAEVERLITLCRPGKADQAKPFRRLIEQIERRGPGGYAESYQVTCDTYSAPLRGRGGGMP